MRRNLLEREEEIIMGLLKTVGTVAVASAVHGRVQRRQQQRWAAQDHAASAAAPPAPAAPAAPPPAAAAAPAPPTDMGERLGQLKQLGELLDAGVLTEAEFQQQKARILNG
jgi:predicted lipid-binding transport protein (Tim44 family)